MADEALVRPLVIRFGALGDLIQATSLFQSLHQAWGQPCDLLAAHGWPGAVVRGLATVRDVATVDSRRTPYWLSRSQWRAVAWLRRRPAGPAWLIEPRERPADKSLWLLVRAGVARNRIVDAREVPRQPLEHAVDYLHRVAARTPAGVHPPPFPLPTTPPPPRLHLEDEELEECRQWLAARGWRGEPVVVLQTQSRRANRGRWPDACWVAAARGVLRRIPEARVLLAGTPREIPEIRRLAAACADPRVEEAAADLPLRRPICPCGGSSRCSPSPTPASPSTAARRTPRPPSAARWRCSKAWPTRGAAPPLAPPGGSGWSPRSPRANGPTTRCAGR